MNGSLLVELMAQARSECVHAARFGMAGRRADFHADRRDSLRWARYYLATLACPEAVSAGEPDFRIYHLSAPAVVARLKTDLAAIAREWRFAGAPFFQKRGARIAHRDGITVVVPERPGETLGTNATFPEFEFYLHDRRTREICLVSGGEDLPAPYPTEAPRLVRDVLTKLAGNDGATLLHCACIAFGDTGILICGAKGAGKTTTMLECLSRLSADFVCNDRVALVAGTCGARAHAWPMNSYLLLDTVRAYPPLVDRLPRLRYPQRRFWTEDLGEISARYNDYKVGFTPQEIVEAFDCRLTRSCTPRHVLFLDRLQGGGMPKSEDGAMPLSPAHCRAGLEQSRFPPDDEQYPDVFDLSPPGRADVENKVDALLNGLAAQVDARVIRSAEPARHAVEVIGRILA